MNLWPQETGEVLLPQDMKKSQIYAGKKICFEQEEVKEIKTFDMSGEHLVIGLIIILNKLKHMQHPYSNVYVLTLNHRYQADGIQASEQSEKYFHVRPAQFLYPDEGVSRLHG